MKSFVLFPVFGFVMALSPAIGVGETTEVPALNKRVLQFALDQQGKQVGNGECWTLAADALSAAGAQRPGSAGVPVGTFGRALGQGEEILPGDVVQFTAAKFVHKTKQGSTWKSMQQHTAIVYEVHENHIKLLNQNYNGQRIVGPLSIDLSERTQGTVQFFRPSPTPAAVPSTR